MINIRQKDKIIHLKERMVDRNIDRKIDRKIFKKDRQREMMKYETGLEQLI